MTNCMATDCLNNNRLNNRCGLPDGPVINSQGKCTSYKVDMDYIKANLRAHIKLMAPNFVSLDESTQEMVYEGSRRIANV